MDFQSFREEVKKYLDSTDQLKTFRIKKHQDLVQVIMLMKVEYYVTYKLTEDVNFFKPIANIYLQYNYKDKALRNLRMNIFCEKKET